MTKFWAITATVLLLSCVVAQSACPRSYTIQAGDSLSNIAAVNLLPVTRILAANPQITQASLIQVGQVITIPCNTCPYSYIVRAGDSLASIATDIDLTVPHLLRANTRITNANLVQAGDNVTIPCRPSRPNLACRQLNHTVQSGDTLFNIAQARQITVVQLLAANAHLFVTTNTLQLGWVLQVPCASYCNFVYTVLQGDSLASISAQSSKTLTALLWANNATINDPAAIVPGQWVQIPCNLTCPLRYHVRAGDSVSRIAADVGISESLLLDANPIITNANSLQLNWQLLLPCNCPYQITITQAQVTARTTISSLASANGVTTTAIRDANPPIKANASITTTTVLALNTLVNIPCPVPRATAAPTPAPTQATCPSTYVVKAGDTVLTIAASLGVTITQVLAANSAVLTNSPDSVQVGMSLSIPCRSWCNFQYNVLAGDSFQSIAIRSQVTEAQLQAANPQITNVNNIWVGQPITIPCV